MLYSAGPDTGFSTVQISTNETTVLSCIYHPKSNVPKSPTSFALGRHSVSLVLWLFLSPAYGDTELETLEGQLEMARTFVTELDSVAGRCLEAGTNSIECSEFRLAINARALTHYQALCEPLITWRDGLIIQRLGSDDLPAELTIPEAERTVQILLELEERCGRQALAKRTKHIMAAYSLSTLSITRRSNAPLPASIEVDSQRRNLMDSFSGIQSRLRAETADLWLRLQMRNEFKAQQQLLINLSNPTLQ